jgi:hypothetical protein
VSGIWIRINGQEELRQNVRRAIKTAGFTQDKAARAAGIKYSRLIGCLGSYSWFTEAEVYAIAKIVKTPASGLIGESIFRGEPREPEFDFMPERFERPSHTPTKRAAEPDRERAICCVCGSLRLWATRTHGSTYVGDLEPEARMTKQLTCETCAEPTRHALLRTDPDRNVAEEQDHTPLASALALRERNELIERMRGFNVDVDLCAIKTAQKDRAPVVDYQYDASKSQWRFELNTAAPYRVQLDTLRSTWDEVASGQFSEKISWNPEDGVWTHASPDSWAEATDELVNDLTRFLVVEKRRLVQEVNDDVARRQFASDDSERR